MRAEERERGRDGRRTLVCRADLPGKSSQEVRQIDLQVLRQTMMSLRDDLAQQRCVCVCLLICKLQIRVFTTILVHHCCTAVDGRSLRPTEFAKGSSAFRFCREERTSQMVEVLCVCSAAASRSAVTCCSGYNSKGDKQQQTDSSPHTCPVCRVRRCGSQGDPRTSAMRQTYFCCSMGKCNVCCKPACVCGLLLSSIYVVYVEYSAETGWK